MGMMEDMAERLEALARLDDRLDRIERMLDGARIGEKDRTMTIDEAAKMLGAAKSTVYQWTSRGVVPHFKLGRMLLFKHSELMAFIERHRSRTKEETEEMADEVINKLKNKRKCTTIVK